MYDGNGILMLGTLNGLPWDVDLLRGRSSVQPAEARNDSVVEWFWKFLTVLSIRDKLALMHACIAYG
jgi:hypothetical protein